MPDHRRHRGPHPQDHEIFGADAVETLQQAAADLAWLLSRKYPTNAALKLVGDRYRLVRRQRIAVGRATCSAADASARLAKRVAADQLDGRELWIDGYNVLTTVEAALAQGVLLEGLDECLRDMASVHGTFRQVQETAPALTCIGTYLAAHQADGCRWLLDRPVSNSGRLRQTMLGLAAQHGWQWRVELSDHVDSDLAAGGHVVATADSVVLDRCQAWLNLAREVVEAQRGPVWLVRFSGFERE